MFVVVQQDWKDEDGIFIDTTEVYADFADAESAAVDMISERPHQKATILEVTQRAVYEGSVDVHQVWPLAAAKEYVQGGEGSVLCKCGAYRDPNAKCWWCGADPLP